MQNGKRIFALFTLSHPSHLNVALRSLIFLMVIYQYKRFEMLGTVYGMAKELCFKGPMQGSRRTAYEVLVYSE